MADSGMTRDEEVTHLSREGLRLMKTTMTSLLLWKTESERGLYPVCSTMAHGLFSSREGELGLHPPGLCSSI